jgi:hypothetical protein
MGTLSMRTCFLCYWNVSDQTVAYAFKHYPSVRLRGSTDHEESEPKVTRRQYKPPTAFLGGGQPLTS